MEFGVMANDASVTKARAKKDLLWALVVLCVAMGGVYEYLRFTAPWDETTIFLSPMMAETTETTEKQPALEPQKEAKTSAPAVEENKEALVEFLAYMDKVNAQVDEILARENNVLSHIHTQPQKVQKNKDDVHVFQDGKIEIYDSEKGVVDVVSEGQTQDKAQSQPQSQPQEKTTPAQNKEPAQEKTEVKKEPEVKEVTEQQEELQAQEKANVEAQEKLQQQVQKDLQNVVENGGEAPVVLIPGLGVPAAQNITEDEEVDLDNIKKLPVDEVEADMQVIGKAMEQIDSINIDDLHNMTLQQMEQKANESMKQLHERANITVETDDQADDGAVNMLQQIKH